MIIAISKTESSGNTFEAHHCLGLNRKVWTSCLKGRKMPRQTCTVALLVKLSDLKAGSCGTILWLTNQDDMIATTFWSLRRSESVNIKVQQQPFILRSVHPRLAA